MTIHTDPALSMMQAHADAKAGELTNEQLLARLGELEAENKVLQQQVWWMEKRAQMSRALTDMAPLRVGGGEGKTEDDAMAARGK